MSGGIPSALDAGLLGGYETAGAVDALERKSRKDRRLMRFRTMEEPKPHVSGKTSD